MTESEARLTLGVDSTVDSEEVTESYEEAVFEQASFFMRRIFLPKLALARIKKLEAIESAARILGVEMAQPNFDSLSVDFSAAENVREVLEAYNRSETTVKLQLANTSSAAVAREAYVIWIQNFENYSSSFLAQCDSPVSDEKVKLSEASIFNDYHTATKAEKERLIRTECARLRQLNKS